MIKIFKMISYDFYKEIFDRCVSLLLLLILLPLFIFLALIIFINLGNPIIFCHIRAGLNGEPFRLFKFRSMTNKSDSNGELLPPEERLNSFGIFIRSTSLDELPSLINVIKGEMSFIGPRPLLLKYVPLYSSEQILRLSVKPGITGLAQVNGRNSITWNERFRLDVKYVRTKSFLVDLNIIVMTIVKVFTRQGITPKNKLIMEPFTGNKNSN